MQDDALQILDTRRIMAVSTVRPDGWPQTTIVGYANLGFTVYFLIFRASQKFANIQRDDRISIAVGGEPTDLDLLKAVYAGAHASEVAEPAEREIAWQILANRHPNLAAFELPDRSATALMRAECRYVSVLDYSKGFGHTEALTIGTDASGPKPAATRPSDCEVSGKKGRSSRSSKPRRSTTPR